MFASPSDAAAVLLMDLGILLGLFAMSRLLVPERAADRALFGGFTAVLILTYAVWRWHDTLPRLEPSIESLWPYLFFLFEAVAITYTLLSIVILFRRSDRSAEAAFAQHQLQAAGFWPAVDIFICTYNEPLEVLEKSILPALAIDYGPKAVWVLDDTRRPWLKEYCDKVGARYVSRPDNKGAKAGNLNNGLAISAGATRAPLILVLDADFAPQPNILKRMVGLFADPKVAVVQSPQFFYNADPIQHNLHATDSWVDDQRIFFDVFQPAKDAWDCAFCVGTSFIVRRARLDAMGGFPHAAICEDLNLTYSLLRRGYKTRWLNERLSVGLSAEGLPEYVSQRTRWCLGTIQVALLKDGPMRGPGYTVTERIHFAHGVLNWLCKPFIVLMLIAPAIYWFAGLPAFHADYLSFLRYGLPTLMALWGYNGWVSRSKTLPLFMEVTHTVTALAVTVTLMTALVRPFGRPFKVTDKGGDRSKTSALAHGRPVRGHVPSVRREHHLGVRRSVFRRRDLPARLFQPDLGRRLDAPDLRQLPRVLRAAARERPVRHRSPDLDRATGRADRLPAHRPVDGACPGAPSARSGRHRDRRTCPAGGAVRRCSRGPCRQAKRARGHVRAEPRSRATLQAARVPVLPPHAPRSRDREDVRRDARIAPPRLRHRIVRRWPQAVWRTTLNLGNSVGGAVSS